MFSACASSGDAAMTHVVRDEPPKAPRSSLVSFASWYGTWRRPSERAVMHFPRTRSDELMMAYARLAVTLLAGAAHSRRGGKGKLEIGHCASSAAPGM